MEWSILYFNEQVRDQIRSLPKRLAARYYYLTDEIKIRGPNLGKPHTSSFGGGLFELRIKAEEGIARAFFCTLLEKKIVILHCFVKKSQKTPKQELDLAKKRLKEIKK